MFRRCFVSIIAVALIITSFDATSTSGETLPAARASSTPSASNSPSAVPIRFGTPYPGPRPASYPRVIYVLGVGTDANTRGKLISQLVRHLSSRRLLDDAWLVPELGWTFDTYDNQCAQDSEHTEGALVAGLLSVANGSRNRLLSKSSYTEIAANVLYAQCVPTHPPSTMFVWTSRLEDRAGWHTVDTPLPALSLILALGAGLETFLPEKQGTSTTTRLFPPVTPIPIGGAVSEVVTSTTSTARSSSLGDIATAILAQSFSYTNNVTTISADDEQAWEAADHAMADAVSEANCPKGKTSPTPVPSPSVSPAMAPNPSTPRSRAPFCAED